jgi:hypothetical protein
MGYKKQRILIRNTGIGTPTNIFEHGMVLYFLELDQRIRKGEDAGADGQALQRSGCTQGT